MNERESNSPPQTNGRIVSEGRRWTAMVLVLSVLGHGFAAPIARAGRRDTSTKQKMKSPANLPPLDADAYWEWAKKKDTAQAYRCFVYHYPNDPRAGNAKRLWEERDLKMSVDESRRMSFPDDRKRSLRGFLRRHPNSRHATDIQTALRQIPPLSVESATPLRRPYSSAARAAMDALLNEVVSQQDKTASLAAKNLVCFGDDQAVDGFLDSARRRGGENAELRLLWALGDVGDSRALDAMLIAARSAGVSYRDSDRAISALGRIADPRAIPTLTWCLQHPILSEVTAVLALGKIRDPAAVQALMDIVTAADSSWIVPRCAMIGLCELGDPRAVGVLLDVLRHRKVAKTKALSAYDVDQACDVAADGIAGIGGQKAAEGLIALLADDDAHSDAVHALGHMDGDFDVVGKLIRALGHRNDKTRRGAAEALGHLGEPAAMRALIMTLDDEVSSVRVLSAQALGELGDAHAVRALAAALLDKEEGVRARVAEALGRITDTRAVPYLVAALEDDKWRVRDNAVQSLGRISDPAASSALVSMALKDKELCRRIQAVEALASGETQRMANELVEVMADRDEQAASDAAFLLARVDDRSVSTALRRTDRSSVVSNLTVSIGTENKDLRKAAIRILGNLRDRRALPALAKALTHSDWEVRIESAAALGKTHSDEAVDALCSTATTDSYYKARSAAFDALIEIGSPRATDSLVRSLEDPSLPERTTREMARALGRLGDPSAVDSLLKALHAQDEILQHRAARALGQIGDSRAIVPLALYCARSDWVSRETALVEMGLRSGTKPFRSLLKHPDYRVRELIAKVLATIAKKRHEILLGKQQKAAPERQGSPARSRERITPDILSYLKSAGSRAEKGVDLEIRGLVKDLGRSSIDEQIKVIDGLVESEGSEQPGARTILKQMREQTRSEIIGLKALGSLAKLEDSAAIENLKKYVVSEDPVERSYAAEVLGGSKQDVGNELIAALDDKDALVRVYAATAILRILQNQALAEVESEEGVAEQQ